MTTTNIIITTCVALFGIIAYHRLARWRNREERRIGAGKDLIASFEPSRKAIETYTGYFFHLVQMLRRQSEDQRVAANEFKRHLGRFKRHRFNKVWDEYRGNSANILDLTTHHPNDIKKILLGQIDNILKFTK